MRILFDTNTLFSAFFAEGNEEYLIEKMVASSHDIVLIDYVIEELQTLFSRKLTGHRKERAIDAFNTLQRSAFVCIKERKHYKHRIKEAKDLINEKDVPILAACLESDVDALVTGDKDFLENPKLKSLRGTKIFTTRELLSRV